MSASPTFPATPSRLRRWGTRIGHDTVWVLIAALFCAVELAVLATDFSPAKLRRRRAT